MNAISPRTTSMDQDETLKALDGYNTQRVPRRESEEQSSDDSDLFLKLAREENAGTTRGPIRRVSLSVFPMHLPFAHRTFEILGLALNLTLCRTVSNKSPISST